ncbi:MAG: MerR family transcriptional regulator [Rickettsiales bacterium]|jgi:DNA-binding transcriptional MerR regulator|nr:MerR family transcriptional regulator [Rickettsiales bacterium]
MVKAYHFISNISKELGIPAHTLRYWEKQFPRFIKPMTGAGGRRYYGDDTAAIIKKIRDLLYNDGMTIAGARAALGKMQIVVDKAPVAQPGPQKNNMVSGGEQYEKMTDENGVLNTSDLFSAATQMRADDMADVMDASQPENKIESVCGTDDSLQKQNEIIEMLRRARAELLSE